MATQSTDVDEIEVKKLELDPSNPRMVEAGGDRSPEAILRYLWREMAVREVALSIAENGYFAHEPLFAAEEHGKLVVIEGNRRLAAVKLLLDNDLRNAVGATDLPTISESRRKQISRLPVIKRTRSDIWRYLGFKHVNGPQQWNSLAKAEYIAWVHNTLHQPLDTIAKSIGDEHTTVKRLYRGLMTLRQSEEADVFNRKDRWSTHFSFSHLYTGLDYAGIQEFVGLPAKETSFREKPIPKSKIANLGELCVWLYGSKSKSQPPLVKSQNPDLRKLDEILHSKDGIAALRRGLPLDVSLNVSRGDERLFREALIGAKTSLQEARGILLTGYGGDAALLQTAQEISDLATNIHDEMLRIRQTASKKKTRARTH